MPDSGGSGKKPGGLTAAIVRPFLTSNLAVLLIIIAACLGYIAVQFTPREEEPQIVVPLADVFVQAPGASAKEVEHLVSTPMERLLWQIDGVEHVYSMARPGLAVITVRFLVGEDWERSLVKLRNKISMNQDQVPSLIRGWVVKPVEIDDVPILTLTLYSPKYDDHVLRRVGEELLARLSEVPDISRATLHGGRPREVRVELDPELMAGFDVTPLMVRQALAGADASLTAGSYDSADYQIKFSSDSFLQNSRQVGSLVVGVHQGKPVYLRDVARIVDGPALAVAYSRLGVSSRCQKDLGCSGLQEPMPAVTLALAKKKGTNAVSVAQDVLDKLEEFKGSVIPDNVKVRVTRNYGQTAQTKSNELMESLFFAVLTVVALLAFTMGWREAAIVALAVPLSFALALFVNLMFGYTINRVTMFALILSLGLVVDDPITNVDNIQRHIMRGVEKPLQATLSAVAEVLPPVIMSTLAIIVSFTPMFFITGMMGPYMAPMAANVPLTVTFSTLWALTVVPWLAYHLLKKKAPKKGAEKTSAAETVSPLITKIYRSAVNPFLSSRRMRYFLVLIIIAMLVGSLALVVLRQIPLKILPFDNKNEFQIVLDMPEGTTLEASDRLVRRMEAFLAQVPEVTDFISYVGMASPMDFNGLVRHYYLRQGGYVSDIRVNLISKEKRVQQSHEIVLRLRKNLQKIATEYGASMKIVELPPGPPVLATLVAEIYGHPDKSYSELIASAAKLEKVMATEPLVVDIDDSAEAEQTKVNFVIDKEKASLHGVSTGQIIHTLRLAMIGDAAASVHSPDERQPLMVRLILSRTKRSSLVSLSQLSVRARDGKLVPLAELGHFQKTVVEQPILHKDLKPVVFVYAELAGRPPVNVVLDLQSRLKKEPLPAGTWAKWDGEGEWKITLRVFRDLGLANAAALVGIFVLLSVQTGSFMLPLVFMLSVPLTLLGIMPGFWLLNIVKGAVVDGFPNPVFFTATSMIGMIALGGIVIRNSVVLVEFIQNAVKEGLGLKEAILESGAVRFRPIVLTAMTTALGAWPITLDPIFSGLAWALIFGLFASTAFTLLVVPVAFYALYRKRYGVEA